MDALKPQAGVHASIRAGTARYRRWQLRDQVVATSLGGWHTQVSGSCLLRPLVQQIDHHIETHTDLSTWTLTFLNSPRAIPLRHHDGDCLLPPSVPTPAPASCARLTARLNSCRGIGHKLGLQPYEHLRQRTYDGGHATTGRRSALLRPSALCFPHFETYLLVRLLVSALDRPP